MFNKLADYKTEQEKRKLYNCALVGGAYAVDDQGARHPLISLPFDMVDFVGGLWRVQRHFDKKIQMVRDKEFVLYDKINRQEKNLFEYYNAEVVCNNCYGKWIFGTPDCVVAKYDTDTGTLWAYGQELKDARAFLGIALFDKHIDLIHAAERKNIQRQK